MPSSIYTDSSWTSPRWRERQMVYKILKEVFIIVFLIVLLAWDIAYYADEDGYQDSANDFIKEIQSENGNLKRFFQIISFFGTIQYFMLLSFIAFLTSDPYFGIKLFAVVMTSAYFPSLFKMVHHQPRPYWIDPEIEAFSCSYTFSYPGMHIQTVLVFGWISLQFEKYLNKFIFCLVTLLFSVLVAFSRMFLGENGYGDLIAGFTYSLVALLLYIWVENWVSKRHPEDSGHLEGKHIKVHLLYWTFTSVALIILSIIVWAILVSTWDIPDEWKENARAAGCDSQGLDVYNNLAGGIFVSVSVFACAYGLALTQKIVPKSWWRSPWWKRLLRLLIALILPITFEVVIQVTESESLYWIGIRSFVSVFYVIGIVPWISVKLGLAENREFEDETELEETPKKKKQTESKKEKKRRLTREKVGKQRRLTEEGIALSAAMIRDVLPKKQKLVTLKSTGSVPKAFLTLVVHNIYSAPVYDDENSKWIGFVDMVDVVASILNLFKEAEVLGEDFIEFMIENPENQFSSQKTNDLTNLSGSKPFHKLHYKQLLIDALYLFKEGRVHRIAITKKKSDSLRNVLTQSGVISFLDRHLDQFPSSVVHEPIKNFPPLSKKDVITVEETDKAIEAFKKMDANKITGVGVVDSEGKLTNVISAKDIRVVFSNLKLDIDPSDLKANRDAAKKAGLSFSSLFVSTKEFAEKSHETEMVTCTLDTTLAQVISQLARQKKHRAFVLNDEGKPISVISLGDILSIILEVSEDSQIYRYPPPKEEKVVVGEETKDEEEITLEVPKKEKRSSSSSSSSSKEDQYKENAIFPNLERTSGNISSLLVF